VHVKNAFTFAAPPAQALIGKRQRGPWAASGFFWVGMLRAANMNV
jgi:hypothetical protein